MGRYSVSVMFACNNPDNGLFIGRFENLALSFGANGDAQHLSINGPSRKLTFLNGNKLRVCRRTLPIGRRREWVGNWCWDEVTLCPLGTARLLNALKDARWTPEAGTEELFEIMRDSNRCFLVSDFLTARDQRREGDGDG